MHMFFFFFKCTQTLFFSDFGSQRTLSNMRTPSYIGEVICTDLNLGNLPPYIHGIRVLPTHMNEVWAWEVDIEYCGGLVLDIETRLEVRDLDLQRGLVDTDVGSSSVRDASSDLLEGFDHLGKQLNFSEGTVDSQEWRDEDNPKSGKYRRFLLIYICLLVCKLMLLNITNSHVQKRKPYMIQKLHSNFRSDSVVRS